MPDQDPQQSALQKIDERWQRIESRMCAAVLVAEIASLTLWISLKGLAADYVPGGNASGIVYRAMLGAAVLGGAAHLATRKQAPRVHVAATTAAIVVGLVASRAWAHVGVVWGSNLLNWLQNASTLMLIGGLRGLATRLTLWLALLGASLATSRGKHIHVDVLIRYVPKRLQRATAITGQVAALLVCVFGAIGFCDYIAISVFRADATHPCPGEPARSCETSAGEKAAAVEHAVGQDFFLLGRQASLDWKSLPKVVGGERYDRWMTATEWNAWLDDADWKAHFDKTAVDGVRMDPGTPAATRMPQVPVPGTGEEARGLLIRELDFVFPFGLLIIAIKFLLRILLIIGGRVDVDPESAHAEDGLEHAAARDKEAAADAPAAVAPAADAGSVAT
jgi:Tripartite ATP-independent periplasmic transporters, DctQ component